MSIRGEGLRNNVLPQAETDPNILAQREVKLKAENRDKEIAGIHKQRSENEIKIAELEASEKKSAEENKIVDLQMKRQKRIDAIQVERVARETRIAEIEAQIRGMENAA